MAAAHNTPPSPPIDLRMVGIRLGDTLTWWDDGSITCVVTQLYPSEVRFRGRLMSLSAAAEVVAGYATSGPLYWHYEGQSLSQRRNEYREWHRR